MATSKKPKAQKSSAQTSAEKKMASFMGGRVAKTAAMKESSNKAVKKS